MAGGGPYFDRHERRECVAAVGHLLQEQRHGHPRLPTALARDLGDETFGLVFLQRDGGVAEARSVIALLFPLLLHPIPICLRKRALQLSDRIRCPFISFN